MTLRIKIGKIIKYDLSFIGKVDQRTAKAWMTMFDSVENGILADIQSKTGISR